MLQQLLNSSGSICTDDDCIQDERLCTGGWKYCICTCNEYFEPAQDSKSQRFQNRFCKHFRKPFAAAAVMGIVTFGVFRLFDTLIGGRVIPVCISLIVAILVYAVVMLKIGTLSEDDILDLPMGGRILRISKKFHLLPAVKVEE